MNLNIKNEEIKIREQLNDVQLTQEEVKGALDHSLEVIDYLMEKSGKDLFPSANSINHVRSFVDNLNWTIEKDPHNWTHGFWSGKLWLAYLYSGDEKYKEIAKANSQSFKQRLFNYHNGKRHISELDHHDIGFLYLLSTKADYQITGDLEALETTKEAADLLMKRYLPKAGILQAWGDMNDPKQRGRIIIDCNLNVPLLYFASKVTNDDQYQKVATQHLEKAVATLVREDASTYHTFFIDTETGEPRFGNTHQGYSDDSSWARGQAWGILGFALAYHFNKKEVFLETAKRLAHFFLNRLPNDLVCNWDLIFTNDDGQRDTSAAAIAAIGLLEISQYSDDEVYLNAAKKITQSLIQHYLGTNKEGILTAGVYYYHGNIGVNEYLSFGDYFFMELLMRLHQDYTPFWK
jgi:unsaturated chondroitin disaccharide hydrolase